MPRPAIRAPSSKKFCVPKPGVTDAQLQSNLDYACSQGANCSPIQPGGPCAQPGTVRSRATFAMNSYYRNKGQADNACDFSGTAQITTADPSKQKFSIETQKTITNRKHCLIFFV